MDQLSPRGHKDYYRDLAATLAEIAELTQLGRQTRRHPPEQIDHLVKLLKAYGFVTPILVDHDKRVIDGWAVVIAAKKLGLSKIPVVCNLDLSDVELRALKIALNKISELSSWNDDDSTRGVLSCGSEQTRRRSRCLPLAWLRSRSARCVRLIAFCADSCRTCPLSAD